MIYIRNFIVIAKLELFQVDFCASKLLKKINLNYLSDWLSNTQDKTKLFLTDNQIRSTYITIKDLIDFEDNFNHKSDLANFYFRFLN